MNPISHKIGAILLAFMVMFSTMSFSLDMHFCGKTLVDLKFYQEADSCGMQMAGMDMAREGEDSHCCSDVAVVIPGQDDLQSAFDTLTIEQQVFLASFVYSYNRIFSEPVERPEPFRDYVPPPLIREIQILDQTFLI